jgi:hypothetical protein
MANWADHATDGLMWIAEILLYLLPAIVALSREHPLKILILALNVFLGWTAVGWAAALVWALVKPAPLAVIHPMHEYRHCPFCAETILAAAVLCRYCDQELPRSWSAERLA